MLTATATAEAQTPARGFNVNRFEPSVAGDVFFGQDFGQYTGPGRIFQFRGGILMDYAYQPLVFRNANGSVANSIIDHSLALHAQIGLSFVNRFDINVSLPISLVDLGPSGNAATPGIRALGAPSAGDLRIGARVRIAGESDRSPASFHLGAQVYLGGLWTANGSSSSMGSYTNSDNGIGARGYGTLAGRASILRYGITAGFHYRPYAVIDNSMPTPTTVGSEVFGTAALGLVFANERFMIGAEGYLSMRTSNVGSSGFLAGEANLGIHYTIADLILVGVGAGPGFSQAPGTPAVRALLQLAYSPIYRAPMVEPSDRDHDGVLDVDDVCPDEPMGQLPDPNRRGCPLGDRDHDGVLDPDDQCIDVPQGEHPDPERRGCPDGDDDSDGILNHADQCRTVAQGPNPDPERPGCPDGDVDGDGVLDHADQCRTEPAGPHPDPARPGCPIPDRDHDTVPDNVDHCPDQPGAPSPDPIRNGCPGQVRIEGGVLRILTPVFFATNRDVILPRSFPVLQAVADALRASPDVHRVSVEGHTDDVGDDARNLDLSQRRAASVARWLGQHQVEPARLEAHGFGETRPVTPIAGLRGRALSTARGQNRRVDFRIVDPAPAGGAAAPPNGPIPPATTH